jgi:hypothetical protein
MGKKENQNKRQQAESFLFLKQSAPTNNEDKIIRVIISK